MEDCHAHNFEHHQGRRGQHRRPRRPQFPGAEAALLAFEAAREPVMDHHPALKAGKHRGRMSLFWRVFGGTLLSIAALVILTLTQQFVNVLTEVRQDLNRMHESRGELARREEVAAALKDTQAAANGIAGLRERSLLLEQQLKAAEAERGQLARELQELRERVAEALGSLNALGRADGKGPPSGDWRPARGVPSSR